MRKKLVAANWKMNGRFDTVFTLLEPLVTQPVDGVDVLICPPFPYLAPAVSILQNSKIRLGAQNVCLETDGAFTGEVSAGMLADCGCSHVIVGHSERRTIFAENDKTVAAKFRQAQAAGLTPILCIGETQAQREAGETETVVAAQIQAVVDEVGVAALQNAVLAYEPIWAIGTGLSATPEQAQQVHAFIRQYLAELDENCADSLIILYGGSVKADNCASLFSQPDIDGGLIGGASLKASSFQAICQAAV